MHDGPVHLLLTDVIMPEMNGKDLARELRKLYPEMKSMFMSGYTGQVIASQGILNKGVHFIQKPFFVSDLAVKVKAALAGPGS
ncbi:MAG: response regulator [Desulfobacteraceae bacterium]